MRTICFLLPLLFAFTSCSQQREGRPPKGQELRLNLHSEPPTLDPRKATDTTSISVIKMCFEGLTRMGLEGKPELAAAEKVDISSDGMRYLFTLREAHWSDGAPVRAVDFERTWKKTLDPSFPGAVAENLYFIKNAKAAKEGALPVEALGVKALDERSLQIDLEHPVPYLIEALSTSSFFPTPTHIVDKESNWTKGHYIGNGPFKLTTWKHYHSIVTEKNPLYWDRESVRLEKISLMMVEETSTELSMYENGEIDWAGSPLSSLPEDAIPFLTKSGKLHSFPVAGVYYYIFNTKKFPLNNVNIRRALSLAIRRREIVDHILLSQQLPARQLIPPVMWKEKESPLFEEGEIERAQELFEKGLEELQLSQENFPTLTLTYNTHSGHHKIAQAIQQQWFQAFGIKVKLQNKEWKVFLDDAHAHQFEIARGGGMASYDDPTTFLDNYRYLTSPNNAPQWYNPRFTGLLDAADREMSVEKRQALLKEAERILIDEMPIAPIYFYCSSFLKRPYVKDVYFSDLNDVDFKWAYVELPD